MSQENQNDSLKTYELVKHVEGEETPQVMATVSIHLEDSEDLAFQPAPETKDEPVNSEMFTELQKKYEILMSSLPVGVLIIDENFIVGSEYTEICEEILGQSELEGKNLLDLLTLTEDRAEEKSAISGYLKSFIQTLGEPGTQNPKEILDIIPPVDDTENAEEISQDDIKQIRINYQMISQSADGSAQLLVLIEDITPLKTVNDEVERTEKKVQQLEAIAGDPDLYAELVSELIQCINSALDNTKTLAETPDDSTAIANLSLNIRKAAGLSSGFGDDHILEASAKLLETMQEASEEENFLELIETQLNEFSETVTHLTEYLIDLTGIDIQENTDKKIKVLAENLTNLFETLKENDKNSALDQIRDLKSVAVYDGLSKTERMIQGIIDVTGASAAFSIEDSEAFIDINLAQKLNEPLIHLFLHTIQHNIDTPDARFDRNKVEEANISVSVYEDEDGLVVEMSDDGEGLDAETVKQTIVEKGILTQEAVDEIPDDECLDLIFSEGYYDYDSTEGGIPLNEIQALIKDKLNGVIFVDGEPAEGTTFMIKLPMETSSSESEQEAEETESEELPESEESETVTESAPLKQVYGYNAGYFYLFQIKESGDCQADKIEREDVPEPVIKKWIADGTIS